MNQPPKAVDDLVSARLGLDGEFSVLANDSDPDGDALVVTHWDYAGPSALYLLADGSVYYTPAPGFRGTETVRYHLLDANGDAASAWLTLQVPNQVPRARADAFVFDSSVIEPFNVLANDSDPDGEELEVLDWQYDGRGNLTIGADGTLDWEPAPGFSGSETFSYRVVDAFGGTASATVRVTGSRPFDDAPESWVAIARMGNAWFNGTFGQATMAALQAEVDQWFLGDPLLFAGGVYALYGAPFEPSDLAQSVANNLGLTGQANREFAAALAEQLYATEIPEQRGKLLLAETERFTYLVDDPLYGEAARRFNAEIDAALKYAQVPGTLNVLTSPDGTPVSLPGASGRVSGWSTHPGVQGSAEGAGPDPTVPDPSWIVDAGSTAGASLVGVDLPGLPAPSLLA